MNATPNTDAVVDFILSSGERAMPPEVLDAALLCVVDWFGVALGAHGQEPIGILKRVVQGWGTQGGAQILLGGTATAAAAALVNGTMAHCLDFDDTHVRSIAHLSGPIFAAALAVGGECGATPNEILRAFSTGFEIGGRLGSGNFGIAINGRHMHSTGVFGCLGAAAASSVLYGLNDLGVRRAMGLAATQVAGLTGSFGSPAKPFHAGKAGMNGVLAAQMAREGYHASMEVLEQGGGLDRALVQDGSVQIHMFDFDGRWEITRNTYKPYASCLLTHPIIDAARQLGDRLAGMVVSKVVIRVNPLAIQLAGKSEPGTPFEGKFSLAFCAALGLTGRTVTQTDFTYEAISDPALRDLMSRTELVPVSDMDVRAGSLELVTASGATLSANTTMARGNPERPMSWDDMHVKFISLVSPVLEDRAEPLFALLRQFNKQDDLTSVLRLVESGVST